jgi:hypothetical protein
MKRSIGYFTTAFLYLGLGGFVWWQGDPVTAAALAGVGGAHMGLANVVDGVYG